VADADRPNDHGGPGPGPRPPAPAAVGAAPRPTARLAIGWGACLALLVLAVPLGQRIGAGGRAACFLAEFLTQGARPCLSARTGPPAREALPLGPAGAADLWRPAAPEAHPTLVLVHGLTPEGKDDPRLRWAASLLARGGFRVVVPDLPALRALRLRPDDAAVVAAALRQAAADPAAGAGRIALVAVSVGSQPALAAAASPGVSDRLRLVVTLGGYAEARELVRYFTTGAYRLGTLAGQVRHDPAAVRTFLGTNLDLVRDPTDRAAVAAALEGQPLPASAGVEARAVLAVLANRDPARLDALLAALPAETRGLLDALSPARVVGRLRARLLLVHGRDDPAIPFTESLRLAAAADPARTRLVLVHLLAHVEGRAPAWTQARDLVALWSAVYELFRG
jgi:pimeloyl-ACP methyl ester carboxylesterase